MKLKLFTQLLTATIFTLTSCKKEEFEGHKYKVFMLKEGNHYSTPREVSLFTDHKMKFHVKFDSSAIYPAQGPGQRGINKLYGFSDCGSTHHTNSARFGWEWYNNELQLNAYTYADSIMKFELITAIPLDTEITCTIDTSGDQYIFTVEGPNIFKTTTMKRGCSGDGGAKYKDGPYFGGNAVAPHDIKILIDEVKY